MNAPIAPRIPAFWEALGFTAAEFELMQSDAYKTSDAFSRREKAAIAWAEAMTPNTAKRDMALWKEMKEVFTETEIVEISMIVGLFNVANRLNNSFWTAWRRKNSIADRVAR